jgi:adenosylcobyric acid synthase
MNDISILGTSSDAGKSTLTFIIGKMLQDLGYKVVPFKAQNVSNNSSVANDGSELAMAQYFQADVLNVPTSYHLNPVLLKSGYKNSANMILNGKSVGDKDIRAYYKDIKHLKPIVNSSFRYLKKRYDIVIAEGAGSPVELNLMKKDLSNIHIAKKFNTKIILVADIQKGGVFASIWGVYNLLPKKLRKSVIGVVVNKFCGDRSLFDNGIKIIEQKFKIPVLGVLPYKPLNIGFEDSASLLNYTQKGDAKIKIGVIKFPHISNYNDFEPLILDHEVQLDFITSNIHSYDMLILPGSKKVLDDLKWLKTQGLFSQIKKYKKTILGICGGYEMMFEYLKDKKGVEHKISSKQKGFGFVSSTLKFKKQKILKNSIYNQFNMNLKGYEIHHGHVEDAYEWFDNKNIKGTFLHGLFENDNFRTTLLRQIYSKYRSYNYEQFKKQTILEYTQEMSKYIDIKKVLKCL